MKEGGKQKVLVAYAAARPRFSKFSREYDHGAGPFTARGWVYRGLTVQAHPHRKSYTIAHEKSGKTMGLTYISLADARVAAWRLAEAADWSRDGRTVGQDKRVAALVHAVRLDLYADLSDHELKNQETTP